ncbi:S24 family peptidase (plasmid) [Legionella sp. D16C41]|uniref:S24 family peptidase n=1 Tax=Legionella sp. D16C41 TaxID=3402688 RepID=UPI003AF6A9C8
MNNLGSIDEKVDLVPSNPRWCQITSELIHIITKFNNISITSAQHFPLYCSKVAKGFPSPAKDYLILMFDLNEYLIKRPAATFIVRAQCDSMKDAGILNGDLLIVDQFNQYLYVSISLSISNSFFVLSQLQRYEFASLYQ